MKEKTVRGKRIPSLSFWPLGTRGNALPQPSPLSLSQLEAP